MSSCVWGLRSSALVLATSLFSATIVEGRIVAAAVIPHGDFAYDPSLVDYKNGSAEIHNASVDLGAELASLAPDLIFLSTPHGIALDNDFLFYENSLADGYAVIGEDMNDPNYPTYQVPLNCSMDPNVTASLLHELSDVRKRNVTGLSTFADSEPTALRWGEVVPLTFLDTALATGSRLVVLSQPLRRYTEAKSMRGELLTLGADLFELLDGLEETVVVVVSCDLAHTHLASGPYGYSPAAEPFDKSVGEWAATLDPFPLLEVAASLEAGALSCGFTGLVLLHGILAKAAQTVQKSESSGDSELKWTATMYVDAAPTYYGMMVASFFPPE